MDQYVWWLVTGIILVALTVAFFLIKRLIGQIDHKFKDYDHELRQQSDNKTQNAVNFELINKNIQDILSALKDIKEETKTIVRIDGKIQLLTEQINKIPEMKKDLDAAHALIRDVKNMHVKYVDDASKVIKILRTRSHYLMNKLMFIKTKAEAAGWKLEESNWQLPSIDDAE